MATQVKPRKPREPKAPKPKVSGKAPSKPMTWGKLKSAEDEAPEDEAEEDEEDDESEVESDDDAGETQERLPGMEQVGIPDLERAIKQCHKLGLARKQAQDDENKAKDKVNKLLHKHREEIPKTDEDIVYKCDGIVARLSINEKLTVRKAENDSHQD